MACAPPIPAPTVNPAQTLSLCEEFAKAMISDIATLVFALLALLLIGLVLLVIRCGFFRRQLDFQLVIPDGSSKEGRLSYDLFHLLRNNTRNIMFVVHTMPLFWVKAISRLRLGGQYALAKQTRLDVSIKLGALQIKNLATLWNWLRRRSTATISVLPCGANQASVHCELEGKDNWSYKLSDNASEAEKSDVITDLIADCVDTALGSRHMLKEHYRGLSILARFFSDPHKLSDVEYASQIFRDTMNSNVKDQIAP